MNRLKRISLFADLNKKLSNIDLIDIENGIMCYCLHAFGKSINHYNQGNATLVYKILEEFKMPTDFETIIELFESLLDADKKTENGIVFTPKYIADYIVNTIFKQHQWKSNSAFIDPGCGCGIFLISAAECLYNNLNISIDKIIENYIFGIDIEENNVKRCILTLRLLSAKYDGDFLKVSCNVHCCDSLKTDWALEFQHDKFTFVVGNPPYVNPHDMYSDTVKFLKTTFKTTKTGVFNIFYAFIEHAMECISQDGVLGYIVPNNFLTIKSAYNLRAYLQHNKYLSSIIDFGDNMVFKPVRTYNCILFLEKKRQELFEYYVSNKTEDIEMKLQSISFEHMNTSQLDLNGWKLVDERTRKNLNKIENNMISIKPFIRTGIATLKDTAFMVECNDKGYYKYIENNKIYIENGLVKPIYKIPELKLYDNIAKAQRYIIFPYIKKNQKYVLISENELKNNYPLTYKALSLCKDELDTRDKGKPNPQGWYAYGRTQGLNKYGKKLLFPTFSNHPKFMYVENEDALFCNGYGVFENDVFPLDILIKILNSRIMDYYIKNTSYSIEGGFYCYQKKYIERFSIPCLNEEQINKIQNLTGENLDDYLWNLYGLE